MPVRSRGISVWKNEGASFALAVMTLRVWRTLNSRAALRSMVGVRMLWTRPLCETWESQHSDLFLREIHERTVWFLRVMGKK